ncbi:MAG: magnesium protoporphyrin IX methyltransferase [Roseobacter sp.]
MRDDVSFPAHPVSGSAPKQPGYRSTLDRVETYFDKTATQTWARLTSDAPVSKIRQTVREGRDRMRALMLNRLPADMTGQRVLDAGCGAGQMTIELARRGADVLAIDVSPALVEIAENRLPEALRAQVTFADGDMLSPAWGRFDHVIAMDSLIYYTAPDIGRALAELEARTQGVIAFTVAPRTPALMAMWYAGKIFPRSDRSPVMIPHVPAKLTQDARTQGVIGKVQAVERVASGFYISQLMELRT